MFSCVGRAFKIGGNHTVVWKRGYDKPVGRAFKIGNMKEYLLYLFGELTEYHSEKYPDIRFWKNDEYGVVLELEKSGALWVYHKIWWNFSDFFSLQYTETQQVMKDVLEEHLKLGVITPDSLADVVSFGWKSI